MTKLLVPFLLLISINAFAFAKVIADVGTTIDAAPFINQLRGDEEPPQKIKPKTAYESYYTEQSKNLTIGKVKSQTINIKNLPQPIFIIGSDEKSLNWLDKYHSRLKKIKAIGFIVNLKNSDEYKKISGKYKLPLFPINGDAFADKFNIHHYPVLISQHRIEQ
jgi:integrating conjugative element protein (TIGR03765 family)